MTIYLGHFHRVTPRHNLHRIQTNGCNGGRHHFTNLHGTKGAHRRQHFSTKTIELNRHSNYHAINVQYTAVLNYHHHWLNAPRRRQHNVVRHTLAILNVFAFSGGQGVAHSITLAVFNNSNRHSDTAGNNFYHHSHFIVAANTRQGWVTLYKHSIRHRFLFDRHRHPLVKVANQNRRMGR